MVEQVRKGTVLIPLNDNLLQIGSNPKHSFVLSGANAETKDWIAELIARRILEPLESLTPSQLRVVGMLRTSGLVVGGSEASLRDLQIRIIGLGNAAINFARLAVSSGTRIVDLRDSDAVDADVEYLFPSDALGIGRKDALHAEFAAKKVAVRRISQPHLVVSTETRVIDEQRAAQLLRANLPHLPIVLDDRTIQVGPFLLPDRSPCHMCMDFSRREVMPDWANARKILSKTPLPAPAPALAATAAGLALQLVESLLAPILHHGDQLPPWANGTAWRITNCGVEETQWDHHRDCGCSTTNLFKL